jgi:regulator of RNase E activity RraA
MKIVVQAPKVVLVAFTFAALCYGQLGMFSKEQLIEFTPDWHGERFADGRPHVPDSALQRLKNVTAEEAWEVLETKGYRNQFETGWTVINPSDERLVGRVVTAVYLPYRPDLDSVIRANGKKEGRIGDGTNSWIIDTLRLGDAMVVDLMGWVKGGPIIGDNLGTSIYTKTHNGLIVHGSVRDTSGIKEIKGFEVFCRGMDPGLITNAILMGINVPIRIGQAIAMPGDVAVSDPEGITFIPPQFVEEVADKADLDHLIDEWGHMMLREQKYTPGQIDTGWTNPMIEEFNRWAASKGSKLRLKER